MHGRLVGEPQALRGLHDRDHRRAALPERGDALGCRLRQHDRLEREALHEVEVTLELRGLGSVDANHERRRGSRAGEDALDERPGLVLARRRYRILEVGDHRVRARLQRTEQLLLVRAGGEQE